MCLAEKKVTAFITFSRTKNAEAFWDTTETENSHSRASSIAKTCSGFNLIIKLGLIKRKRWSVAVKLRICKSCASETSNSHLSTVMVWRVQLAETAECPTISIPLTSLGRKQGLLRAEVISSAVTL